MGKNIPMMDEKEALAYRVSDAILKPRFNLSDAAIAVISVLTFVTTYYLI